MKPTAAPPKAPKKKSRKCQKKYALAGVAKQIKAAKSRSNHQIEAQAKHKCMGICDELYSKLPRELRNMVYERLIIENNATFFDGDDGEVQLANGCNPVQHRFDASYTGPGMHKELIEELDQNGARFDFR